MAAEASVGPEPVCATLPVAPTLAEAPQAPPVEPGSSGKAPSSVGVLRCGSAPVLGGSAGRAERPSSKETVQRLLEGRARDDLERPKSLRVAEQSRLQEERRLQERQEQREREREQRDRERAKAAVVNVAKHAMGLASPSGSAAAASAALKPAKAKAGKKPQPGAGAAEALSLPAEADDAAGLPGPLRELAPNTGKSHDDSLELLTTPRKMAQEPMCRSPMPNALVRQIPLGPSRPEDNYELSDQADSDADEALEARRRAKKRVPSWCSNYLEVLHKQADLDPDGIFGGRVPKCALDVVFPEELYKSYTKGRPKRNRGSSGDWRRDRLTAQEIGLYKRKMGQMRVWTDEGENVPPGG